MLKPDMMNSPAVRVMINIGAGFDVPTGFFVKGKYGENILLGGLGIQTGIVGMGNFFKSTITHFKMLSAANKIFAVRPTYMNTYDTEINTHRDRLKTFASRFEYLKDKAIIENEIWGITDKSIYYANEWFELVKKYLKDKQTNIKDFEVETPFLTIDRLNRLKIILPTFTEVDSFTDFETADVAKIQDENELGDSGGNTIHMRQGLAKLRFLQEINTMASTAMNFFLLTAQLGDKIQIANSPFAPIPPKKLQHMKTDTVMKGVTNKFTFQMSNCWHIISATNLINQGTKSAEYPKDGFDTQENNQDLNIVTLKQLRSKSGPSGITLDLIVSQTEGVLSTLSEFHYIKETGRFGLSGSVQNYNLDLLPDVKLSRTTIRSKIDSNEKLRRAINITSELCQMKHYYRHYENLLCTPKELYDDLIKLGYDWDILLNTRGWWTINNETKELPPFLSTKDLLLMRTNEYTPYWLESDKKTIRKKY